MASRPLPLMGNPVPIPRHFSKGFSMVSRTTRMPASCCSKRILSPGLTPRDLRISTGTVICPLLVTLARKICAGPGFAAVAMVVNSLPLPEYSLLVCRGSIEKQGAIRLSPVIERQHNQQGEADGRGQGQHQKPKKKLEARALS